MNIQRITLSGISFLNAQKKLLPFHICKKKTHTQKRTIGLSVIMNNFSKTIPRFSFQNSTGAA